jgi:Flp pilus assembly protein protease CpaA
LSNQLLLISAGIAAGAALVAPVRLLYAVLLRQRGLESGMERRQQWFLLAGMCAAGGLIAWRTGVAPRALYLLLLLVIAAVVALVDAKYRIIPNELVIAVFVLSAVFGLLGAISFRIANSLLGFAACFVVFFIPCAWKRKIGAGDVKFASAMGFALGLTNSLYAIVCMGAFVLLYFLLEQRIPAAQKMRDMIPMGPFLAAALVIVSAV